MNRRRLGKGLDALLGHADGGASAEPGSIDRSELTRIGLDRIGPNPYQPRRDFAEDELQALADSIREHGVLQPVLVRPDPDDPERYQLIAGERRLRACVLAQVFEIPARIMALDDRKVAELALVENLQREDLGPLDKANAFRDYLTAHGCTQEDLAKRLGIDRSTVANLIRLLDLPETVAELLRSRKLTQGHARALLALGEAEAITAAASRVVEEGLSVRQTEALVATGDPYATRPTRGDATVAARKETPVAAAERVSPPQFSDLETHLRQKFGTSVMVKPTGKGKGRIVIEFANEEEFARVSALIRDY